MKTTRRLTAVALVLLLLLSLCGCMAEELPEEISRPETTRTTPATTLSTAPTTTQAVTATDTTAATSDNTTTQTATQTATTVVTTQVTTKVTVTVTGSTATVTEAIPTGTTVTRPFFGVPTDEKGRPIYEPRMIQVMIKKEYIDSNKEYTASDFPGMDIAKIQQFAYGKELIYITLNNGGDAALDEAIEQAMSMSFVDVAEKIYINYIDD